MSCNRLPPTLGNTSGCRGRRASAPRPGCPEHAGKAEPGPSRTPRGGRRPPRRRAVHDGMEWLCWTTCGPLHLAPRRRRRDQELERQLHELGRVRRPHRRGRRRHVPMRQRACDSRPRSTCRAPGRLDLHGPDRHQDLQHVGAGHLGDGSADDVREGRGVRGCSARSGRGWRSPGSPLLLDDAGGGNGKGQHACGRGASRIDCTVVLRRTGSTTTTSGRPSTRSAGAPGPDGRCVGGRMAAVSEVHELVAVVRRHRLDRLGRPGRTRRECALASSSIAAVAPQQASAWRKNAP